ncbi:hypothetical protein HS088_TW09G00709 [Tripterygium wilfordii]|uniref:Uncharacterized protein n=1 Tax=Tripterygium wilfordii TaxID=458696 RepID=A0A7J7D8P5_TRIWF|nr:hypothetical protein HS088_TW09G00709 [Tripterygium wilfordii]
MDWDVKCTVLGGIFSTTKIYMFKDISAGEVSGGMLVQELEAICKDLLREPLELLDG